MSFSSAAVVTISGMPGSGTTTAARLVAAATGLRHVNTGAIFRQMAEERGVTLNEFGKIANQNPELDRELDDRQIALARRGGILLEGRLAGFMAKNAGITCLAVWLDAPHEERLKRVAGRDSVALDDARSLSLERESDERVRFIDVYGFDLNDRSIYDLVMDSACFSPTRIRDRILELLQSP